MDNSYYFVRHGESLGNKEGRFSGTSDDPLSKKGAEQAVTLRNTIENLPFDLVYSSPLSRALHTALISLSIARPIFREDESYVLDFLPTQERTILLDPRLCERSFGDLQGLTKDEQDEIQKYAGKIPQKSFTDRAEGGENFADLKERYMPLLYELHHRTSGLKIEIFTHNGPMRLTRGFFEGLSEEEILNASTPNCGVLNYLW